jgi:hypothetical protein
LVSKRDFAWEKRLGYDRPVASRHKKQPSVFLTEEQKHESRRALLRGIPVGDPELAATIVRTSREARRTTVPLFLALFLADGALGLYLYFGRGLTGWLNIVVLWISALLLVFVALIWLIATRAIRRNTPVADEAGL